MRIRSIHINTQNDWRGGEQQTLFLLRGLVERGHEAVLATRPESPLGRRATEAGIALLPIRPINEVDPRAVWQLSRAMRTMRPHVLHMHSPHALFLGGIASRFSPRVARVVSRRVFKSIYRPHTLRLNWLKYRFGADRYIAVSEAVRDLLIEDGMRADAISVVHSGVDPAVLEPFGNGAAPPPEAFRRELDLPPQVPLVVSVGALDRTKGPEYLLRAAKKVLERRDVAFLLVGSGPLERPMARLAADLGVARCVRLTGFREDALRFLAAASLYVQPSLSEGLGTSILDALLLGKPVVACSVGGIPEIIQHDRHGLLVPPGDVDALAAAVLASLEEPARSNGLAQRGRAHVLDRFTAAHMVDGTVAVYRAALESLGGPQEEPSGRSGHFLAGQ